MSNVVFEGIVFLMRENIFRDHTNTETDNSIWKSYMYSNTYLNQWFKIQDVIFTWQVKLKRLN